MVTLADNPENQQHPAFYRVRSAIRRNAALAESEPETLAPVVEGTPEPVDPEVARAARAA